LDELRREMAESVEDYLEQCAAVGKDPEKPYRGEFLIRTTPEVHRAAVREAEAAGMSLNAWVEGAITAVVGEQRDPGKPSKRTTTSRTGKKSVRTSHR
jgi:predicted HicB family RNase H-like nuclease